MWCEVGTHNIPFPASEKGQEIKGEKTEKQMTTMMITITSSDAHSSSWNSNEWMSNKVNFSSRSKHWSEAKGILDTTTWCSGMFSGGGRIVEAVVVAVVVVVIGIALLCYYACPSLFLFLFFWSQVVTLAILGKKHMEQRWMFVQGKWMETHNVPSFSCIYFHSLAKKYGLRERGSHNAHLISLPKRDQVHYSCRVDVFFLYCKSKKK